jgi:hypothetical protein
MSRLEHIVLSCRPSAKGVYVACVTLYLDDSGTHLQSPVAIAAAWVSPVPRWNRFMEDWERSKTRHGFECFHTAECVARNPKSEFATWKPWQVDKALRNLAQLSLQRSSQGFSVSVNKKDYDEVLPDFIKEKTGTFHYTWAVRNVLGLVEKWRAGRTAEPIEYVFDWMSDDQGQIEKRLEIDAIFASAATHPKSMERYGIQKGCHSFRDRCDVTPLQASDLLAWCTSKRSRNAISGQPPKEPIAVEIWNGFISSKKVWSASASRQELSVLAEWGRTHQDRLDEIMLPYINLEPKEEGEI